VKHRAVIENVIGETRAAVYEGRRLVELHLERESLAQFPQTDDIYIARVTNVDGSINGAFLDLGLGNQGFVSFSNNRQMPKLLEGQFIRGQVAQTSNQDKVTRLRFLELSEVHKVGVVEKSSLKERLAKRFDGITFDEARVSAVDEAAERRLALKNGGAVTFDQTQALLAIDVDKGQGGDTFEVCLEAISLIAAQIRLRGLGGLIVIDFPNLRSTRQRNQLAKAMEREVEADPATIKIAPLSRFGCLEMTRSKDYPSLDSLLNNRFGEPTSETLSLRALRQLVYEAKNNGGAQFTLFLCEPAMEWLDTGTIGWRSALIYKIGERFKLVASKDTGFSIQADR
jgi:Ribonuclease G/E